MKLFHTLIVTVAALLAVGACKEEEKPKAATPIFVPVENLTVNLLPAQSSYLHTTFELKVPSQEVADKIKVYMPELRNGAIFLLSTRHGAELVSHEGKQKLGSDLAAMMNGLLGKDGLKDAVLAVNFTSFIIQ